MGKLSHTNPPRSWQTHLFLLVSRALLALPGCIGLLVLLHSSPAQAQAVVLPSNVPATALPLAMPAIVAFGPTGDLYIAETGHHVIRKVDVTGIISTVVGTGNQGYAGDGGPALSADLNSPGGLALDSAGNLYFADTGNQRVREVSAATGIVTTVAGTGIAGFSGDGGLATVARLSRPGALALDAHSALYVADVGNHRIRRLSVATGVVTTFAGNGLQMFSGDGGPAISASIDSPTGLAVDSASRLYIADTHNGRVRIVDPTTGLIQTIVGTGATGASGDLGSSSLATLANPSGLTVDATGNLYITDSRNGRIRRVDAATGTISTVAGDGTEAFAGDGSPAVSASLDTPRSIAFSPSARLTIADTGNGRVRQLTGPVAPPTTIQTIAGLGVAVPGVFTLSAPAVIAYGSGVLTAALASGTTAAGSVDFLETTTSGVNLLGTAPLAGNTVSLSLATLPAGTHRLIATYTGDSTHSPAQSTSLQLTVSPLQLNAFPAPASMLFGQTPPFLTGSVSGVLPQDSRAITATFLSAATSLSPPAAYPIAASLSGAAAGNYTVLSTPANLTVSRAPALVSLASSVDPVTGTVSATAGVVSTTTGVPGGTITLLDALTPFAAYSLASGTAPTWTSSTLTAGPHSLTAYYSGNIDFLPATSPATVITVPGATAPSVPVADFSLSATGITSQTVASGSSANYTFAVQLQGAALSSPITLAAAGLPSLATASFNPQYIPPGGAVSTFTVTVAIPKSAQTGAVDWPARPRLGMRLASTALLAFLCPLFGWRRRRSRSRNFGVFVWLFTASLLLLAGCGDRVASTSGNSSLKPYTVTISGTATTATGGILQHTASVTLNVQ